MLILFLLNLICSIRARLADNYIVFSRLLSEERIVAMYFCKLRNDFLRFARLSSILTALAVLMACGAGGSEPASTFEPTPSLSPTPNVTLEPLPSPTITPIVSPPPIVSPRPTSTPSSLIRSDFDADGCVGYADYRLLTAHYGDKSDAALMLYDSNKDGAIDFEDYALLLQDWGTGCTPSSGKAVENQFNFVVEIADDQARHLCAGVILDKSWVLSLASCVEGLEINNIRVVASRLDSDGSAENENIYELKSVSYYPEDRSSPNAGDLTLINVGTDFVFGSDLSPIAINKNLLTVKASLIAIGWGIPLDERNASVSTLHYVNVGLESLDTCSMQAPVGEVPIHCINSTNNAYRFDRIDVGGPVVSFSEASDEQQGLSYRLSGLLSATDKDTLGSNRADIVTLLTNDQRITQWINTIINQQNIYGDIDGDGCVGDADYQLYLANNGLARTDASPPEADVNADGIVNFEDYAVLLQQWGQGCLN